MIRLTILLLALLRPSATPGPRFYWPSVDAMMAALSPMPPSPEPQRRFPIAYPNTYIDEELAEDGYSLKGMESWH